jgi:DUF971 family protein
MVVADRIEVIGQELAIRWSDASESYLGLELLRRNCPCAACAGETDLLGTVHGGKARLTDASFQLVSCEFVGGYALCPRWKDGHETGIYSFSYLRELAAG